MANKHVGFGCAIAWDSAGGSSYTTIGSVIDGDKTEASWATAKTTLLSEKADTFDKTSYDPGEFKFTVVYDPLDSEYTALKTNFLVVNGVAPSWRLSFPNIGAGSGATTETFAAHIVKLSREIKKDNFLMVEISLKLTGAAF